ncbi:hypothetical protein Goe27_02010 [Bacillus phage vB_BsuM-Goe27]|nr:hypothetical protein Goe7_c01980 [Bacillus phage vB_BveM-Goe7]WCS69062.1 hypothetical protein Goe17_02030 [Bacillus phage vB_BsuM-Goe17]WCS69317.1 hypothetical protein Goe20_02000 [Bacillus phage vB_BsuM-Goe20]WCS69571.1 hypothetical protein Goe24_01960 [Bacillus phage vB_BsuM-Goe24]WCS70079.1 hypothetical protein Goe27_02010 [Bacillus phage vB_BsuM-Goe27]
MRVDFKVIKDKLANAVYCHKAGRFVNKDEHKDCNCKVQ